MIFTTRFFWGFRKGLREIVPSKYDAWEDFPDLPDDNECGTIKIYVGF